MARLARRTAARHARSALARSSWRPAARHATRVVGSGKELGWLMPGGLHTQCRYGRVSPPRTTRRHRSPIEKPFRVGRGARNRNRPSLKRPKFETLHRPRPTAQANNVGPLFSDVASNNPSRRRPPVLHRLVCFVSFFFLFYKPCAFLAIERTEHLILGLGTP